MWEHVIIESLPTSHQCAKYKGECGLFCWGRRMGMMFCTQPLKKNFFFNFTYVWFTSTAISECWCNDALFRGEIMEEPHGHIDWVRIQSLTCLIQEALCFAWCHVVPRWRGTYVCVVVWIDACYAHIHTHAGKPSIRDAQLHQMGWYSYPSWLSAS